MRTLPLPTTISEGEGGRHATCPEASGAWFEIESSIMLQGNLGTHNLQTSANELTYSHILTRSTKGGTSSHIQLWGVTCDRGPETRQLRSLTRQALEYNGPNVLCTPLPRDRCPRGVLAKKRVVPNIPCGIHFGRE